MSLATLHTALAQQANPLRAEKMQTFFKTGPGEYGEGDQFIGVSAPALRKIARTHKTLPRQAIETLLYAPIHEERLLALFILVLQFQQGDTPTRTDTYDYYLQHRQQVNNWDLVDSSASYIVGAYLHKRPRSILHTLAQADNLWERRIAIIATHYFIRQHDFATTLSLAQQLLHDPHDLIHKATGWMLREIGKRDEPTLTSFLDTHAPHMPRTMLRYALEKMPTPLRRHYMTMKPTRP